VELAAQALALEEGPEWASAEELEWASVLGLEWASVELVSALELAAALEALGCRNQRCSDRR